MKEIEMVDQLLLLLPYWHYKIERPLKQLQNSMKISFETYYCLRLLCDKDAMSMKEIATYLHMSKQQVNKIMKGLYEHHFVRRIFDSKDRRITKIAITEEARHYVLEEMKMNEAFSKILESEFNHNEIIQLQKCIESLVTILCKKESEK